MRLGALRTSILERKTVCFLAGWFGKVVVLVGGDRLEKRGPGRRLTNGLPGQRCEARVSDDEFYAILRDLGIG